MHNAVATELGRRGVQPVLARCPRSHLAIVQHRGPRVRPGRRGRQRQRKPSRPRCALPALAIGWQNSTAEAPMDRTPGTNALVRRVGRAGLEPATDGL